jgi:hypothetical protein
MRDIPEKMWVMISTEKGDITDAELSDVRQCVARGRPLGTSPWVQATAARLGLVFTLRKPGRPRKRPNNQ